MMQHTFASDFLKPKVDQGIGVMESIFRGTSYAPQSKMQQSMYASSKSGKSFKKNYKTYTEEEDDDNWLKQKRYIQNIPNQQRKIFRCTNGGNQGDNFNKDNKIMHYKNFSNEGQFITRTDNFFKPQQQLNKPKQKAQRLNENHYEFEKKRKNPHNQSTGDFRRIDNSSGRSSQVVIKVKRNQSSSKNPHQQQNFMNQEVGSESNRYYDAVKENNYNNSRYQKTEPDSEIKEKNIRQLVQKQKQQQQQQFREEGSQQEENQEWDSETQQQQSQQQQQQKQCFEKEDIDPAWLDNLSYEDLQDIIPEELFETNQIDFTKLVHEQSDYFMHLFGLCACTKCTCGLCKCDSRSVKLKLYSGFQTTYGKDFLRKSYDNSEFNPNEGPNITGKLHQTKFGGFGAIDKGYSTMYKSDFIKKPFQEKIKRKHETIPLDRPAMKTSSYNKDFVDWKNYDPYHFKKHQHISTDQSIPFQSKTNYSQSFGGNNNIDTQNLTAKNDQHKQKKSPYPMLSPFEQETTSMSNFRPFQVKAQAQTPSINSDKNKFESVPSFDGQFRTTGMRDFKGGFDKRCRINQFKKEFRKQILRKLEGMRDKQTDQQLQKLDRQIKRDEESFR